MITMPEPPTHSPVIVPAAPWTAISAIPATTSERPKRTTTTRAAPNPVVIARSVGGRRRGRCRVRRDDDRCPVGDDLAHGAGQLGAVEAHRQDRVRAEQRAVRDKPVERLAAGVLEQARVLVDLAAAERAEAGHQVAA